MKVWKYINRETAFSAASRGFGLAVMLGDDNRFWVVTMADASRLEKMGFDWAR